jgi:hypothetical protein
MIQRILNLVLVVSIVVGAFLAWRSGREQNRLRAEYERLTRITGELKITDPKKVHIQALKTGEPLHFAWHCYLPANYRQIISDGKGSSSSSWNNDPREFIARVRLRQDVRGDLQLHTFFSSSSGRMSFGDTALTNFLKNRWEEIQVEQIGANGVAVISPEETVVLLKLTLPEKMQAEAREQLPSYTRERFVPVVYQLTLGQAAPQP